MSTADQRLRAAQSDVPVGVIMAEDSTRARRAAQEVGEDHPSHTFASTPVQPYRLVSLAQSVVHDSVMPWSPDGEPSVVMWQGRVFVLATYASSPATQHVYRERAVWVAED